jgi:hypothetical protein
LKTATNRPGEAADGIGIGALSDRSDPSIRSASPPHPAPPVDAGAMSLRAVFISYMSGGLMHVGLDSRCAFVFPASEVEALAQAGSSELRCVQLQADGAQLHWPRLGVCLSLAALMRGEFGSPDWLRRRRANALTHGSDGPGLRRKSRVLVRPEAGADATPTSCPERSPESHPNEESLHV